MKDGATAVRPSKASATRLRSYEELAAESPGFSPYAVARNVQEEVLESHHRSGEGPVLIFKVAELSTDEILKRLSALGVTISRDEFVEAARGKRSAWELSLTWRSSIPPEHAREHDFAALAICQLWERWCPQSPSMEMVDDWMMEGYACMEDGDVAEACELWWKAWQVLRGWLTPQMRTFSSVDQAIRGSALIYNWILDFAMYSVEVAVSSPQTGARARDFILECQERFPDEEREPLNAMRRDLAEIYFAIGESATGRDILEKMIESEPRSVASYATLSDALSREARTQAQLQEALEVLLRAKEANVIDGKDYDLDARIRYLREARL